MKLIKVLDLDIILLLLLSCKVLKRKKKVDFI